MQSCIACIDGHFGHGNLGDEELWASFVREHGSLFSSVITLTGNPDRRHSEFHSEYRRSPYYYLGWRYLRGFWGQSKFWRSLPRDKNERRVLIWMGGLLGEPTHVAIRNQSLDWANFFHWAPSYWFGDVEPKAGDSKALKRIVATWNNTDSWVAVRSDEAAKLLREAGMQRTCRVGIDPVLYRVWNVDRLKFANSSRRDKTATIVPCQGSMAKDLAIKWWAEIVRKLRASGMETRWGIFDSAWDQKFAGEIATACGDTELELKSSFIPGEELISTMARSSICISGRYHGAIFPLAMNIPTIALGWNSKIRRLYTMLGIQDWCHSNVDSVPPSEWLDALIRRAQTGDFSIQEEKLDEASQVQQEHLRSFTQWAGS